MSNHLLKELGVGFGGQGSVVGCSPERLPCLIEYLRSLYCSPGLALDKLALMYTKYTRPYDLLLPLGIPFGLT